MPELPEIETIKSGKDLFYPFGKQLNGGRSSVYCPNCQGNFICSTAGGRVTHT